MSSYPVGVTSYIEPVLHALRRTPTGQTAICSGADARPVPGCFDAEAATSCPLCREIIALRRIAHLSRPAGLRTVRRAAGDGPTRSIARLVRHTRRRRPVTAWRKLACPMRSHRAAPDYSEARLGTSRPHEVTSTRRWGRRTAR